mmetsp:Transcript_119250/g.338123  ORF Transcript_119250/g.338123 Transcript_119250/m.338123 type:complete len:185 (+) Transcript_119250:130-684(+)
MGGCCAKGSLLKSTSPSSPSEGTHSDDRNGKAPAPHAPVPALEDSEALVRPGMAVGKAVVRAAGSEPAKTRPKRGYSIKSEEALDQLDKTNSTLSQIEQRLADIDDRVRSGRCEPAGLGGLKTELAQLEAAAHKLESNGVDNIYTSELTSGRLPAKDTKHEQLRRLEALFSRIDDLFGYIKQNT